MIIESLACGTPVAAYDVTGPKDIIQNGYDGYFSITLKKLSKSVFRYRVMMFLKVAKYGVGKIGINALSVLWFLFVNTLKLPTDLYSQIDFATYKLEKNRLQLEMFNLQQHVIKHNQCVAIVFEGHDAAGKGSTIKRLVESLIPKYLRVVRLDVPSSHEMRNWFDKYKRRMPKKGQIVFFDRSWYGRALV